MKSYKHYVIIQRLDTEKTTESGIILTAKDPSDDVVEATIHSCMKDHFDGIKEGDKVLVVRRHALRIEGGQGHYAIEPQYIVGTP